eukprot:10216163-Alexandrium_andersonii.AAC.1
MFALSARQAAKTQTCSEDCRRPPQSDSSRASQWPSSKLTRQSILGCGEHLSSVRVICHLCSSAPALRCPKLLELEPERGADLRASAAACAFAWRYAAISRDDLFKLVNGLRGLSTSQ